MHRPETRSPVIDESARSSAFGWAAGLVVTATAVALLGRPVFALPDVVTLYLLVIMGVASKFGRGPSVFAAALSVAAYDFFFIPPFYTFDVADLRHTLTFAMMFVTGLVISGLTRRVRRQEILARTEAMRSSLLSAVSHDLRTPLGAITGASSMLLDGSVRLTDVERKELLETIYEEAERLEHLVTNLLDMTRVQSGALEVKRQWVPLEESVVSVLSRLESELAGRDVAVNIPDDLPLLSVDPVLFEQVFVNLLENVAKHTPAATEVEIRARVDGTRVVVEVMDRGPGLPKGGEEQVFEKFYRGRGVRGGGVGLGLAICRGIVEAHGGTLSAANRAGGGATFRIELPIVGAPPSIPRDESMEAE